MYQRRKTMIKRVLTTVALGVTLTAGPGFGQELKTYDELTELQKGVLQLRATAQVEPGLVGKLFYDMFTDVARDSAKDETTRYHHVFAECASDRMVGWYLSLDVINVMYWTDTEITAVIGNESFDVGVQCSYEAEVDKKNTRRL
jgi:hypothetical protein